MEILWFAMLLVMAMAVLVQAPAVPLRWIRVHAALTAIPALAAGVVLSQGTAASGWFMGDQLALGMVLFVQSLGFVVERFSVRFMLGEPGYRRFFLWLTLTIQSASLTWMSNSYLLLLAAWGMTLLGIYQLMSLNKSWEAARASARIACNRFILGWSSLAAGLLSLVWLRGAWTITDLTLLRLGEVERDWIGLCLVVAMLIPAAQWPFHRWLLDSVTVPTPVSAVMHAGFVNAGGILFIRFGSILEGSLAQTVLVLLSMATILIGSGVLLIQVDYKRQLAVSTIVQMGFMLLQCALGNALAAVIHLVMHGIYKASLFLLAGSAVPKNMDYGGRHRQVASQGWTVVGWMLSAALAAAVITASPGQVGQWLSGMIGGLSLQVAWQQMAARAAGRMERVMALITMVLGLGLLTLLHSGFSRLLQDSLSEGTEPARGVMVTVSAVGALVLWLGYRAYRSKDSQNHLRLYVWLLQLGEPNSSTSQPHLTHLASRFRKGALSLWRSHGKH